MNLTPTDNFLVQIITGNDNTREHLGFCVVLVHETMGLLTFRNVTNFMWHYKGPGRLGNNYGVSVNSDIHAQGWGCDFIDVLTCYVTPETELQDNF